MPFPSPEQRFPISGYNRLCFLKNIITNPQIEVGDYTYYDDFEDVHRFEQNVKYLFDFVGDKLIIGKFCMIASGATFIMNGANHLTDATVTKDVAPYSIVGGNPAKEIRRRFSEEQIELLLQLKWWDWPLDKITKNLHLLTGNDFDELSTCQ